MNDKIGQKAVIVKRKSADDVFNLEDHVPLGKVYDVRPGSIRMQKGFNITLQVFWEHEVVDVKDAGNVWFSFPTELLQIMEIH